MEEIEQEIKQELSEFKIIDVYSLSDFSTSDVDRIETLTTESIESKVKLEPQDVSDSTVQQVEGTLPELSDQQGRSIGTIHVYDGLSENSFENESLTSKETGSIKKMMKCRVKKCSVLLERIESTYSLNSGSVILGQGELIEKALENRDHDKTNKRSFRHYTMAQHEVEVWHYCMVCNKPFTSSVVMKKHISLVHEEKKHKCDICDYRASTGYHLRRHQKSVHQQKKDLSCTSCHYHCSEPHQLKEHIRVVHDHIKPYKCCVCHRTFSQPYFLQNHTKAVHFKPDKCSSSRRSFSKGISRDKNNSSSGHCIEKPFECERCGVKFSRKADHKVHQIRVHETRDKLFPCAKLGAKFAANCQRSKHRNCAHLREKMYKCKKCKKSYFMRHHLDRHMNSAHKQAKPAESA